jgi:hypothetical protein
VNRAAEALPVRVCSLQSHGTAMAGSCPNAPAERGCLRHWMPLWNRLSSRTCVITLLRIYRIPLIRQYFDTAMHVRSGMTIPGTAQPRICQEKLFLP